MNEPHVVQLRINPDIPPHRTQVRSRSPVLLLVGTFGEYLKEAQRSSHRLVILIVVGGKSASVD
jgi:hypothetical protein